MVGYNVSFQLEVICHCGWVIRTKQFWDLSTIWLRTVEEKEWKYVKHWFWFENYNFIISKIHIKFHHIVWWAVIWSKIIQINRYLRFLINSERLLVIDQRQQIYGIFAIVYIQQPHWINIYCSDIAAKCLAI